MKKSLLLLASMLMSAGAFAQWVRPVPQFTEWNDAPDAYQYLYNVEAGAFYLGANDWGTRASVSPTQGYPIRMQALYEDEENTIPLGQWALYVTFRDNKWEAASPDAWDGLWVDGGRAGFDLWKVTSLGNKTYEIENTYLPGSAACPVGKLAAFGLFDGVANNRLFFYNEANADELTTPEGLPRYEGVYTTWAFVDSTEYNAILPKMAQYSSAVKLGDAIESAKANYEGIKLADAETIYGNLESTVEELDSATNKLVPAAIANYQKSKASADNPADFTDLVPNANFEGSNAGWTTTTGAQNVGLATNRCDNAAYPGTTMTGQFWENWKGSAFSGKMYTQLESLPAGVYKLKMAAFINPGTSGHVYMNQFKTDKDGKTANGNVVTLGKGNDIPADFEVFGYINDGDTLEIGLEVFNDESNWIGIDNVQLTYYGAEADAYKLWYNQTREGIISKMDAMVTPETKYDKNQKAIFNAALAKGKAATTKEELIEAVEALQSASDATIASIEAYKELEAMCEKIEADRSEIEFTDGSIVAIFFDLMDAEDRDDSDEAIEGLKDEEVPDSLLQGMVAPKVVLEECMTSTEDVKAYTVKLDQLYKYCVSQSVQEGQDYTSFIADADFTDPNGKGWTKTKGNITWRGGFHAFPVAESFHSAFDFYQEVTVPDGIYSLSLNGFCRPDDGETEPAAEIYMNDYATKFQSLAGGALQKEPIDGFNCYLSKDDAGAYHSNPIFKDNDAHNSPANNVDRELNEGYRDYMPDGMEGASIAFSAGRYEAKVYGMVEGGKIKLGARCTSEHQWVLWGNFKLTYEGESEEAMEALAESFIAPASEYFEAHQEEMSTPAAEALSNAIDAVINREGSLKESIKTVREELENAKANVAAVAAFGEAKSAMDESAYEYGESAIEAARATYEKLSDIEYYELTTEAIKEYTAQFNDCATALRIPSSYEDASDENPIDFTQVITNPSFDEIGVFTGWDLNGSSSFGAGGDKSTCAERYEMTFNTFQDINVLPEGTYGVAVQGFYRYGSAANDYDFAIDNTKTPEISTFLYAEATDCKASRALPLLGTGALETGLGGATVAVGPNLVVPNTMEAANYWFEAGYYQVEEIIVKVAADGKLRIGVNKDDKIGTDWVIVDNFTLTYYGKDSQKDITTEIAATAPVSISIAEIYSVAGARINALQKGINIVKMSNGDVKKIMVK